MSEVPRPKQGVRTPLDSRVQVRGWVKCDSGMKRPYNEDSTLFVQYVGSTGNNRLGGRLLAVADGMGGHERGDVASSLALKVLASSVLSNVFSSEDEMTPIDVLEKAFAEANEAVFNKGKDSSPKMGTTLVAAFIVGSELYVSNVGDSRCYVLIDDKIRQVTKDDSYVQELVDSGKITKDQAMTHPRRNEITNAIGIYPSTEFEVASAHVTSVNDIDYLLLSSDGLHGVLSDDEIASVVFSSNEVGSKSKELIDLANERGGPDNASLVLAHFEEKNSRMK